MKYDDIQNAIKDAMINKDNCKRDCLRMIVSDIKNLTINANPPKEITDEICVKVLQKSVKTHEDSISQFRLNGREESANKEQAELLALLEQTASIHFALEYRGDAATAQKYLDEQAAFFGKAGK